MDVLDLHLPQAFSELRRALADGGVETTFQAFVLARKRAGR
ncbi:hypothetical protein [Mycolicibacterium sp. 050158]|nr:hypothetical protein [Mycolicibacterium sp. 050158]MDX1888615.1 hypothetical protein [Mycolicibacterium sp. 050158]